MSTSTQSRRDFRGHRTGSNNPEKEITTLPQGTGRTRTFSDWIGWPVLYAPADGYRERAAGKHVDARHSPSQRATGAMPDSLPGGRRRPSVGPGAWPGWKFRELAGDDSPVC